MNTGEQIAVALREMIEPVEGRLRQAVLTGAFLALERRVKELETEVAKLRQEWAPLQDYYGARG